MNGFNPMLAGFFRKIEVNSRNMQRVIGMWLNNSRSKFFFKLLVLLFFRKNVVPTPMVKYCFMHIA